MAHSLSHIIPRVGPHMAHINWFGKGMVVTDVTSTLRTYGVAFLASLISHNQLAIVSLVALELAC